MKSKKAINNSQSENQKIIDSYDFMSNAASSQDCTGLIPAGPVDEEELKSYEAVYHYQPPKVGIKKPE